MKNNIVKEIEKYYTEKVVKHGATSKGVDWNGKESHYIRFKQLSKILPRNEHFSVLDFGCGFGALIDYLLENNYNFDYIGYDISKEMITAGKEKYGALKNVTFENDLSKISMTDYVIANGLFNVKLKTNDEDWKEYILNTLKELDRLAEKGFSFNILTSYSDKEYMKDYLYYANPLFFFDYCKQNFSKDVALLHDYKLYEFTILVRK